MPGNLQTFSPVNPLKRDLQLEVRSQFRSKLEHQFFWHLPDAFDQPRLGPGAQASHSEPFLRHIRLKLACLCGACTRCLGRPGYNLGTLLESDAGLRTRGCLVVTGCSLPNVCCRLIMKTREGRWGCVRCESLERFNA